MSKVILVQCESYDNDLIYEALNTGIEALGGIEKFVGKSEKILVKPNLLSPSSPEGCITTDPVVIKEFARILSENGYEKVKLGDSPATVSCAAVMRSLGLSRDDLYGAEVAEMTEMKKVSFPEGKTAKEFEFSAEAADADAIINLCKMKTHALERVTGAVKNLYGLVCGKRKAMGHVKYANASVFARMLSDMHSLVDCRLNIMDAVTAMEGNGPRSGDPVHMGLLLFSDDPVALDTVFCWLIDLDPEMVPTNVQGSAMGIGTDKEEEIEVFLAGNEGMKKLSRKEVLETLGKPDFNVDRADVKKGLFAKYSDIARHLSRKPSIDGSKCIKCGLCVESCPVGEKALAFRKGREEPPVYDYHHCIRCYCCQELCPAKAITVKR